MVQSDLVVVLQF